MKKQVIIVESESLEFKRKVQTYLDNGYTVAKLDVSAAVATNYTVRIFVAIVEKEEF